MIKKLISVLVMLFAMSSVSAQGTCVPKVMGGKGVSVNVKLKLNGGGWISWWCPTTSGYQLRLLASKDLENTYNGLRCFLSQNTGPTLALAECAGHDINMPELKMVWMPDHEEILRTRPQ